MNKIVISDTKLVEDRLTSIINVPRDIQKYFKSRTFILDHDTDVYANKSILNVTVLSTVLPLAWLTGLNVTVKELDSTFKQSMDDLKKIFKNMYPEIPFTTNIKTDNLIENKINFDSSRRTALLFSGGVDSTYSLITNMGLNPSLILIRGLEWDSYTNNSEYWKKVISWYSDFSKRLGIDLHILETNAREILDARRIEHDFHKCIKDGSLWGRLQHWIMQPLTAPLSINRFDQLIIASSWNPHPLEYPWASQASTHENAVWANLQVKYDGNIPRVKKILGDIKGYINENELMIRVCHSRNPKKLNCSACEKCYRTITSLVLAGIDPASCGFSVDDSTFKEIKYMIENKKLDLGTLNSEWLPIKEVIPEKIEYEICGSNEFFEWFKNYDLYSAVKYLWFYRNIYNNLPYTISKILDKIYRIMGINIHEHSPVHPEKEEQHYI